MNEMMFQQALERGEVGHRVVQQRRKLADEGHPVPGARDRIELARRHGVTILAGTDCGGNALCRHGNNAQELVMLAANGLTPEEALRASTGLAADTLQVSDRGRIRVGCFADIVVCFGDPTTDIAVLADDGGIAGVIKNGELAFVPSDTPSLSRLGA